MSYRDWHVGMKVVCIDDAGVPGARLYRGSVYTIKSIRMSDRDSYFKGVPGPWLVVELVEIINPTGTGFNVRRFRPVQPRKTDISLFTAMLNGQRQDEPA